MNKACEYLVNSFLLKYVSLTNSITLNATSIIYFIFLKFTYLERETKKERMSRGGAEKERERENPKQALPCRCGA